MPETAERRCPCYMNRAERLLAQMNIGPKEAVIIHNPSNMFYLSGYTGEGLVVLAQGLKTIVTDFRYTEQAEKQAPEFACEMISKGCGHEHLTAKLLQEKQIETIYFEEDYVTVKAGKALAEALSFAKLLPVNGAPEALRQLKDEDELARMTEACRITSLAYDYILGEVKPGMTEKEVALKLEYWMLTHGADGLAFTTIAAAGANGSLPHAIPGDYKIQLGDMVTLDYGAKYKGYCADMTRTFSVGKPSDQMRKIYETVLTAQKMAEEAVAPGKMCQAIDAIARDYIYAQGYEGCFGHGLGHGVGIDIHEDPRFSMACPAVTQEGMMMTVEPGIYIPGVGGVRIENTVYITKDGCKPLTFAPKDLIIL